jgi:hypothetical protein
MFRIFFRLAVAMPLVTAAFLPTVSAAVINTLNVGSGGTATVSLTTLTFNPDPSSTPAGPPWNAEVATGTNLSFIGGPLSTTEAVLINGGNPITAASIPITQFMTFAAHPNLVFSLASIGPGSSNTNCASVTSIGQSCSVFAGSPVVLTLTASGSSASFAVAGKASDTGVAGLSTGSNYTGSFSDPLVQPLPNGLPPTPANIQAFFCPSGTCTAADFASGRSITSPFGGQFFATAIPEPSQLGLVGLSLLAAFGAFARRRRA